MAVEYWNITNPVDKKIIPSSDQENSLKKESGDIELSKKEDWDKTRVELLEDIRMWKANEIRTKLVKNPSSILHILNNLPNYKLPPEIHNIIEQALGQVSAKELVVWLQNSTDDVARYIASFLPDYFRNVVAGDSGRELVWQLNGQIDKSQETAPLALQDQMKIDATNARWAVQRATSEKDILQIDLAAQTKVAQKLLQKEWVDTSQFIE